MDAGKIHLTKENGTYLLTLYGKALDYRRERPILGDKYADEIVRRIDFDLKKLITSKGSPISLPLRAKLMDQWTREFIEANPESIVLNIGCGLDSRVFRIDPPASVRWYDVDLPHVIELRRQLYQERHDYTMIGVSVTDPGWLDGIPGDRPVIVVAEGMLHYIQKNEVIDLFCRVTRKFPHGQLIFDAYNQTMIQDVMNLPSARKAGVTLHWSMGDARAFGNCIPRLEFDGEIPILNMPESIEHMSHSRADRILNGLMGHTTYVKRKVRHLRYKF